MSQIDLDDIQIARLSTKGQLVLPEKIRKRLKLKKGTLFIVEETLGEPGHKMILLTVLAKDFK